MAPLDKALVTAGADVGSVELLRRCGWERADGRYCSSARHLEVDVSLAPKPDLSSAEQTLSQPSGGQMSGLPAHRPARHGCNGTMVRITQQ